MLETELGISIEIHVNIASCWLLNQLAFDNSKDRKINLRLLHKIMLTLLAAGCLTSWLLTIVKIER